MDLYYRVKFVSDLSLNYLALYINLLVTYFQKCITCFCINNTILPAFMKHSFAHLVWFNACSHKSFIHD